MGVTVGALDGQGAVARWSDEQRVSILSPSNGRLAAALVLPFVANVLAAAIETGADDGHFDWFWTIGSATQASADSGYAETACDGHNDEA
jgi:hypothetical protein